MNPNCGALASCRERITERTWLSMPSFGRCEAEANEPKNLLWSQHMNVRRIHRLGQIGVLIIISIRAVAVPISPGTTELRNGWRLASAWNVVQDGGLISESSYDASRWYEIHAMPATVLEILQEDSVYPNLYFGKNLTETVPRDLFRQDWWYRTVFTVPPTHSTHWLVFKGINYRAEIWLNGERLANNREVAGMYSAFEFNVTGKVKPGAENVLAVKVTPEQSLEDIDGVELADSWFDWINSKYLGIRLPDQQIGISYVPDRNAGIWKQVYLRNTDEVEIRNPYVQSDLPLPSTRTAALTVYCDLQNGSGSRIEGTLSGEILREGKIPVRIEQRVTLAPGDTREVVFAPENFQQLTIANPDLWWPYQWGPANLYGLKLQFSIGDRTSDSAQIKFGIRKITQHRDSDQRFPALGGGGNFYLKINGIDFLVRGADYAPDLLYRYSEAREASVLRYVKDMGLNLLRWESKISSEHILDLADEEGIPVMMGWMCCNQWEKWDQWDAEDHRVARASLRSQIHNLRPHASVVMWANGSDGLAPVEVRNDYRRILSELHWEDAVVDTVSSFNKDSNGNIVWDGIRMQGPYSWRPPSYWFDKRYQGSSGACAEQGDNESIPPYESLRKFIPADKLWPMNNWWFYHAGSTERNNTLANAALVIEKRYGPSKNAAEFAEKAQIAHYENTRAQFEAFAANGWDDHKMTMYWMLNSPWPSFFGHIIDYYLKPGGAYYGAKKGLRPVNIVYDYYAEGDRTKARIFVVNQTLTPLSGLQASVALLDLDGVVKFSSQAEQVAVRPTSSVAVLAVPRVKGLPPVFFVRCQLRERDGRLLAENVYWQAGTDDELVPPDKENAFDSSQLTWADLSPLNHMKAARTSATAEGQEAEGWSTVTVKLRNESNVPAFFVRAEIVNSTDGNEILPITWTDNYVTLFGGESITLQAHYRVADSDGMQPLVRVEGHNLPMRTEKLPTTSTPNANRP
jgi:exo-1,4-beta-D-glucosaminidase